MYFGSVVLLVITFFGPFTGISCHNYSGKKKTKTQLYVFCFSASKHIRTVKCRTNKSMI
jgi:hypothetical protein